MAWRWSWAALLTSTRIGPSFCLASAIALCSASMSVMSHAMNSGAGSPLPAIAFTSASDASRAISTKATFDPCAQKCSTIDAPMPLPPPVMKTARSFRLGIDGVVRHVSYHRDC